MMSKTHIAYGLMATIAFVSVNSNANLRELVPGAIIGSCLPDIDTQKSWIAQAVPFVDDKLRSMGILEHRGITHANIKSKSTPTKFISFLSLTFLFYALNVYFKNDLMIGITLGYITHIVLDVVAEKINITCKHDYIVYKVGWIVNTILILNNKFEFKNLFIDGFYFTMISMFNKDKNTISIIIILILIILFTKLYFHFNKSKSKNSKTKTRNTTNTKIKRTGVKKNVKSKTK